MTAAAKAKELQDVTQERSAILLWMPHMITLAFMVKHYKASASKHAAIANDPGMIACTDGQAVWYGDKFNELERPARNFIFLHELMHGILRHPTRFQLIALSRGFVIGVFANYAADAIINEAIQEESIAKSAQFAEPKDFPLVWMSTIHKLIKEAIDFTGEKPPSSYDPEARLGLQMETVYDWLIWGYDAIKRKRKEDRENSEEGQDSQKGQKGQKGQNSQESSGHGIPANDCDENEQGASGNGENSGNEDSPDQKEDQNGNGGDESEKEEVPSDETALERIARTEEAWDIQQIQEELRELLESGVSASDLIAQANREIGKARSDLEMVIQGIKMQGLGKGNMLLSLENDLPKAVVPWNKILRKEITRTLGTKIDDSYTKYGTSTRAAVAMGRRAHYQPGTTIFTERPKILIVVDSSGSHIPQLEQCFSETWAIARIKNAGIDVIVFDDGVQQKIEINNKSDFKKLLNSGVSGGGGTCMNGVFEEIKKMKTPYRGCVVMTDGWLEPPKETYGVSLTWLITSGGTDERVKGTGTVINLPDFMRAAA